MRTTLFAVLLAGAALPALAADRCIVPKGNWRPVDELKSTLTAKGWSVNNVKTKDGCYEVYGKDAQGRSFKAKVDPETLRVVKMKRRDKDRDGERSRDRDRRADRAAQPASDGAAPAAAPATSPVFTPGTAVRGQVE